MAKIITTLIVSIIAIWYVILWKDIETPIPYSTISHEVYICMAIAIILLFIFPQHSKFVQSMTFISFICGFWNIGRFPTFPSVAENGVIDSAEGFAGIPLTGILAAWQWLFLFVAIVWIFIDRIKQWKAIGG